MEEFMREYKRLKRLFNSVNYKQNKTGGSLAGTQLALTNKAMSQSTIPTSKSIQKADKNKRQRELKEVLLQTM